MESLLFLSRVRQGTSGLLGEPLVFQSESLLITSKHSGRTTVQSFFIASFFTQGNPRPDLLN